MAHHAFPRHQRIGGLDFYVDTWVRQKMPNATRLRPRHRSSSAPEIQHATRDDVCRLVHLPTSEAQGLMIVYARM
jgi:hypothetical protein